MRRNNQFKEVFKRSGQGESKTYTPKAVKLDSLNMYLVDNPGLGENRGYIMNMYQAIIFKKTLEVAKSVRFLLTFSYYAVDDSRSKTVKSFFSFLETIIPKN